MYSRATKQAVVRKSIQFLILESCFAVVLLAAEYHGTVKSGGLPIPGAAVTATQGDKKLTTTTDDQGVYSFPDLSDGDWTLTIEMFGFDKTSRQVSVAPGAAAADWDLKLQPFNHPETAAAPPKEPTPATSAPNRPKNATPPNPATARNRGQQATANGGRGTFQRLDVNASGEAGAVPGETASTENDVSAANLNQSASEALVVNGSLSSGVNAPQQNDWQGFGRSPGDFAPGSLNNMGGLNGPGGPGGFGGPGGGGPGGRFAGGGRGFPGGGRPGQRAAGGNGRTSFGNARRQRRQYNGNLAFVLDNSALDAKPYSLTGQQSPKLAYAHFRTNGTFGGPLKIPKILSGDNTFFFINYQLTRNRNASIATGLVPTEAEREGVVSGLNGPLSPQALALLNFYPLPNFTGSSRYNYQIPLTGIGNQSNVNARVSHTINSKNQISGGFGWQNGNATSPNLFGFVDSSNTTGINSNLAWTYHFSPYLISNLRYTFSRSAGQSNPFFANTTNVSGNAGIQGNDQSPNFWGPPNLSFSSGITGLSDANFSRNHNNTNAVGENLIWVHGNHNFTFGADYRRLDFNQLSQQNPRGSFVFTGAFTGNDLADFLEGLPATSSIAFGNADKYFRASWVDGFVNDDWRLRNNFSLNIGLRWDFQAPVTELQSRLVNLNIGQDFTTESPVCGTAHAGCTTASQAGYPDSLVRANYHEFQPRIGIAWRPFQQRSTVVRAGYGIYYNTSVYQPLANQMAQQSPLSYSVTQANPLNDPFTLANAFLVPAITATPQTYAVDPNFHIGYLHYWQASVQQNLASSIVLTLTYQGNEGTHQLQEFLPNTFPSGSAPSPFPSGYVYITSNGNSNYNAASVQLQRRFRSGFSWNALYVFSKAIDDAQSLGGRASPGASYAQNWLDLSAERSISSFNRTHTFNLNMQYSTGQGSSGGTLMSGWRGSLLKDWTFATTLVAGSGLPETPIILQRVATGTGVTGIVRADYIGGSLDATAPGYGFNIDAFAKPLPGQWGDAGRNIITGPIQLNVNASAGRVFRIGERRNLDIRYDATNVLNHVTYTSWNATLGNAQFGLPVSANAMRTMQLTLRFRF